MLSMPSSGVKNLCKMIQFEYRNGLDEDSRKRREKSGEK